MRRRRSASKITSLASVGSAKSTWRWLLGFLKTPVAPQNREALGQQVAQESDVRDVIESRLRELIGTRRRRVREEVASVARKWTRSGGASRDLEEILDVAESDKSSRVREAAQG